MLLKTGICWLNKSQKRCLLQSLKPTDQYLDQYGDTAWEMQLADTFVMDFDGLFTHITYPIKPEHVARITNCFLNKVSIRPDVINVRRPLSLQDFQGCLVQGGVSWLTTD